MKTDKQIWPFGRYEVYDEDERLNGFHTIEEANEAADTIEGAVVLDRADRFTYSKEDKLINEGR